MSYDYIFAGLLLGITGFELYTGKVYGRRGSVSKAENPVWYWFSIISQVAVAGYVGWSQPYTARDGEPVAETASIESSATPDGAPVAQQSVAGVTKAPTPPPAARPSGPPPSPAVLKDSAFALTHAEKYAAAIPVYNQAIAAAPDDAELVYWRGIVHWRTEQRGLALDDMRRTMELQPENFDAHRNADRLLRDEKRWDEVLTVWNGYIRRRSSNAEAYFERGGVYLARGDTASAKADITRACDMKYAGACTQATRLKGR